MKILSKDQILSAQDLSTERVRIPEWNGDVFIRMMTSSERDAFEIAVRDTNGDETKMNLNNIRAKLTALCVVDKNGTRLFTDADATELGKKSAAATDRIFDAVQRLNRLTGADVKELAKN